PFEVAESAVKLARTGLADHLDGRAGEPAIFSLKTAEHHLHLRNAVHAAGQHEVRRTARRRDDDAIHHEVISIVATAVDVEIRGGGGGVDSAFLGIDHTR